MRINGAQVGVRGGRRRAGAPGRALGVVWRAGAPSAGRWAPVVGAGRLQAGGRCRRAGAAGGRSVAHHGRPGVVRADRRAIVGWALKLGGQFARWCAARCTAPAGVQHDPVGTHLARIVGGRAGRPGERWAPIGRACYSGRSVAPVCGRGGVLGAIGARARAVVRGDSPHHGRPGAGRLRLTAPSLRATNSGDAATYQQRACWALALVCCAPPAGA